MRKFNQQQRQDLLNILQRGRNNAITAHLLASTLGYRTSGNKVKLRKLIKECIELENDLIGATTGNPPGFFLIDTAQELEVYLDSLENRIRSDNHRRNSLITTWNANNPLSVTIKNPLIII